jgi:hypothetical protein
MSEVGVNGMHNISEPEWKPIGKEGYRAGYLKALDDVQEKIDHEGYYPQVKIEFTRLVDGLKSAYEKEQKNVTA